MRFELMQIELGQQCVTMCRNNLDGSEQIAALADGRYWQVFYAAG